jgi:hypothetical protein
LSATQASSAFTVCATRNKPVHRVSYMKLYSAIEETGKPLAFHSGFHWGDPSFLQLTDSFPCTRSLLCNATQLSTQTNLSLGKRFWGHVDHPIRQVDQAVVAQPKLEVARSRVALLGRE